MLAEHPKVKAVFYPGLESIQNHETAKRQMKGFGGMIGFDVGGVEEEKRSLII
jgi:cystathionine beta-lyase/cystathionine gamma-synthase